MQAILRAGKLEVRRHVDLHPSSAVVHALQVEVRTVRGPRRQDTPVGQLVKVYRFTNHLILTIILQRSFVQLLMIMKVFCCANQTLSSLTPSAADAMPRRYTL